MEAVRSFVTVGCNCWSSSLRISAASMALPRELEIEFLNHVSMRLMTCLSAYPKLISCLALSTQCALDDCSSDLMSRSAVILVASSCCGSGSFLQSNSPNAMRGSAWLPLALVLNQARRVSAEAWRSASPRLATSISARGRSCSTVSTLDFCSRVTRSFWPEALNSGSS